MFAQASVTGGYHGPDTSSLFASAVADPVVSFAPGFAHAGAFRMTLSSNMPAVDKVPLLNPIPEPGTVALLSAGLLALLPAIRRSRSRLPRAAVR